MGLAKAYPKAVFCLSVCALSYVKEIWKIPFMYCDTLRALGIPKADLNTIEEG